MTWLPIETAPRNGIRIKLLIPYDRSIFTEAQCTDRGHWEQGCFRFDGDDGADDIQPTHWMPILISE